LRAYRDIKLERDKLTAMIEEVEVALYSPRSQRVDGMPRGGSGPANILEDNLIRHDELLSRYRQKVTELSAALVEIENAIEVLEPRERTLIRLYYAQGLTWEEVCVEMNYSWSQIHRIHGAALKALRST
jgi:RNA polymerase sigma factor (sigma-70 family)